MNKTGKGSRTIVVLGTIGLLLILGGVGCSGKAKPIDDGDSSAESKSSKSEGSGSGSLVKEEKGTPVSANRSPIDEKYRLSFAEAVRSLPPESAERPPDQTATGKSVGVLYEKVRKVWDEIPLISNDNKLLIYTVTMATDLGEIDIELHPEWAPNHVRGFLALCKVGYYDQLSFDIRVQQISADAKVPDVSLVEAGCPVRLGKPQFGSIGYWLPSDYHQEMKHDEGMVGSCRLAEEDSDGCRFFVALNRVAPLDGHFTIFGKVTRGLDVVKKIFQKPFRVSDDDLEGYHRFDEPPIIRKVTIREPRLDKTAEVTNNN